MFEMWGGFEGNLVAEPERVDLGGDGHLTEFRMLVDDVRQNRDRAWVKRGAMRVKVKVGGALGEAAAEQLHKGDRVYVVGSWQVNEWERTEDGKTRTVVDQWVRAGKIARPLDTRRRRTVAGADPAPSSSEGEAVKPAAGDDDFFAGVSV
ncbi:single-stranded DNA-binding protein [Mobilicoccus caccae]|uniref:Single-stranded DNA-binding protein n=1 Tax=Mobilicoccus caccae TaxID=1859295 RepID=A0ABQ6IWT3_9MICO|nr:single-stranded DNA-binding protein [Mobilicoccus caccae]GMA42400.1 hypothetical protein GCM10025883_44450 [Mobilicoccus caccae]GMA42475.1 hypothetical protein GCM10025883_45200 [Mobilicoccus caccae]